MLLQMDITEAVREIALGDPISTVLFAIGALLLAFSLGVFGVLSFGAGLDFFTPE